MPAIDGVLAWERSFTEAIIAAFQAGTPQAKVVRLSRANHYVFLSNESVVLRDIRQFASALWLGRLPASRQLPERCPRRQSDLRGRQPPSD